MMHSSSKKRAYDFQLEKENYTKHIDRLVKLKSGISTQQIRRDLQQKKLMETVNTVRKIHFQDRSFHQKQKRQLQQMTKAVDYSLIQSIVRKNIQRKSLQIVPRHKHNQSSILKQNIRILQRICKTKPCVVFEGNQMKSIKPKQKQCPIQNDFSFIYESSPLRGKNIKIIKIKFGKRKLVKKWLNVNMNDLRQIAKDSQSVYTIQFMCGKNKKRTEFLQFNTYQKVKICFKIPQKLFQLHGINARLIKIVENFGDREITKANFNIKQKTVNNIQKQINQLQMKQIKLKMPVFRE